MTSCLDRLPPGDATLCDPEQCEQFQESADFHAICNCLDWQGQPIPNCSPKDSLYPVMTGQCLDKNGNYHPLSVQACNAQGMEFKECFCCCHCFAAKTPVAIPSGMRAIGDIQIGDSVLAATMSASGWSWTAQTVQFSSGSASGGAGAGNLMFKITYGDGKSLFASPNQLLLLAGSGKLKRADQLVPGVDHLVGESGASVPIHRLHSGKFTGAIHHIATTVPSYDNFSGSIDNHLINVNGIVSGDYLLQLYQDTEKMKPNLVSASDPVVGTSAYQARHPAAHVSAFSASAATANPDAASEDFVPHSESTTTIPAGAAMLFTTAQETQLADPRIPKRAPSDNTNANITAYYAHLYSSFYPGVQVNLDWTSTRANVFAYTQDGQQTVVIGGQFLRLAPLYDAAMAVGIAFGVASLLADPGSVATRGRALYYGMGVLSRTVLQGGTSWSDTMTAANQQLGALINALIAQDDATGGNDSAALTCLLSVMDAAVSGDELPACAGGPVMGGLKVASASYDEVRMQLTVTFSEAVSAFTATNPKNYRITPATAATAAQIASGNPAAVVLSVALAPDSYDIAVVNVRASDGSTLDPAASKASLTVPQPAA